MRNTQKWVQCFGIIKENSLEQYFYVQFLIEFLALKILESMTNYFTSGEVVMQKRLLVCKSVWVLECDVGAEDISWHQRSSVAFKILPTIRLSMGNLMKQGFSS